ncbi:MAG: dihydroxy-acid dehydratase [Pirellulaceae bacterium]|nr:dihydroxy-acid dehydratase [Pirellulaceae bacterium]
MTQMNWNSRTLTSGWQPGVKSFFHGLKFSDEDFAKPQVGIGVPLLEGNLCNAHAYELARRVAAGCRDAGLLGFPFGTPAVSDNLTQGLEGGSASLVSRNLIASSAECVITAHCYDAMIGLHHCDKNGPGFAMALARTNYPGVILSGGSIQPGCYQGRNISIRDVYDVQADADAGIASQVDADAVRRFACPGPGGCGIAASFNTWGLAMEAIGLMPPQSSSTPAIDPEKEVECQNAGALVRRLLEMQLRPRDILNAKSFRNAAVTIAAAGGSTNAILHLLALAHEAKVNFSLADMQSIFRQTPVLCNFAPRGEHTMVELHRIGGTSVLLKHLMTAGLLDGSQITVTGGTLQENVQNAKEPPAGHTLIAPTNLPFKPFADMQVCFGNLAPDGMVFKVSSLSEPRFRGPAICFTSGKQVVDAVNQRTIKPGHVVVIRELGPVASGMPEIVIATSALSIPELVGKVAVVSDTRISGISHGAIGIHCCPEAVLGGPIALVEDNDVISFDLLKGEVTLHVGDDELGLRRAKWQPMPIQYRRGYLADFAATVTQANQGCVSRTSMAIND